MSAYVIVHAAIKDPDKLKAYSKASEPTVAKFGGEFVFRGDVAAVLCGQHPYKRSGVLRFPNVEAVHRWYQSPDYQALIPERDRAADFVFVCYDEFKP